MEFNGFVRAPDPRTTATKAKKSFATRHRAAICSHAIPEIDRAT
jgi:hypothetical protein